MVRGDVLTGEGLARALAGMEVAYYLIHSMESGPAGASTASGFAERERRRRAPSPRTPQRAG